MIDLRNTAKSLISLTWASTLVAVILIVIIRIIYNIHITIIPNSY